MVPPGLINRSQQTIHTPTPTPTPTPPRIQSLYVASKVPHVIELVQQALRDGRYAPVIGLQTTGEAQIRAAALAGARAPRKKGAAGEEDDEDDEEGISQVASVFQVRGGAWGE